jgi:hypothetical protein
MITGLFRRLPQTEQRKAEASHCTLRSKLSKADRAAASAAVFLGPSGHCSIKWILECSLASHAVCIRSCSSGQI